MRVIVVFWCFFALLMMLWLTWPQPKEHPYCWPTPNEPEQCG